MIRKFKTWIFKKLLNNRYGYKYAHRHYKIRKNSLYGKFTEVNTIYVDTDTIKC